MTIAVSVEKPNVVTLYAGGVNRGTPIRGSLHFPDVKWTSACRNITQLPRTRLRDDLTHGAYAAYNVIAFAPWVPECNHEFLKSAKDDKSNVRGFIFYSTEHTDTIPAHGNSYWSGLKLNNFEFPIYGMRGREGQQLMNTYTAYAQNKQIMTDIHDKPGRARLFIKISTGSASKLPGLWLFLLIVLGVFVAVVALLSLSMHLLQHRRLRSLRRRVAAGQVDLEALGIKRLVVPRKLLDKLPLCSYVAAGDAPPAGAALPPNSKTYAQPACPICLDDFVTGVTTVRELPCKHVYHPACIDSFLTTQSSLCPMCKASALPSGYVPPALTSTVVRRERNLRRVRARSAGAPPSPRQLAWRRFVVWWDGGSEERLVHNEGVEMQARARQEANAHPMDESGGGRRPGKCRFAPVSAAATWLTAKQSCAPSRRCFPDSTEGRGCLALVPAILVHFWGHALEFLESACGGYLNSRYIWPSRVGMEELTSRAKDYARGLSVWPASCPSICHAQKR